MKWLFMKRDVMTDVRHTSMLKEAQCFQMELRTLVTRFLLLIAIGLAYLLLFSSILPTDEGVLRRGVRSYIMDTVFSYGAPDTTPSPNTSTIPSITTPKPKPKFVQPLKDVDCARLVRNDTAYVNEMKKKRPTIQDDLKNPPNMTCEAIRSRILPARNAPNGYPIAFAKLVYEEYRFLEEQLAITYAEENWYCFALDRKAPVWFRRRFVMLSMCLPNVILSDEERDPDSSGHNHNFAHLDCMRKLENMKWNYVVIMQNHDLIVKTNDELATIFKALNGTNDMQFDNCAGHVCVSTLEKNLGKLNLCPKHLNGTEAEHCRAQNITWGKGLMQVSLTTETVSYVLHALDLDPLLNQLNNVSYGIDEVLYQTLVFTKVLQLPGGSIPSSCIKGKSTKFISRNTIWMYYNDWCPSKQTRHAICIRGMEDMAELSTLPEILVNKVMPNFDYGVISCMAELLFNRSQGITPSHLSMDFYNNLPMVRYNREKWSANFNESNFDCYNP